MKTTLMIALLASRLLFACDPPKHGPNPDASHDASIDANIDATADASTSPPPDSAVTRDAGTDAASEADAHVDASEPTATCPMARQVPFPEVCNAFDDDCDGRMDEGTCADPCDEPW